MPMFSLILATRGRTTELHRFFAALVEEGPPDCECIVVDQNPDDRLEAVLLPWRESVTIRHVRSQPGLARARNIGLHHATGEVIAFPDDDCWYTPGLLREVAAFFVRHPGYSLLSVGVRDESGELSGNRWLQDHCDLNTTNLFRTSVGMALFVRRSRAMEGIRFDETLGVGAGTPFVSGEDTDYVFRLLQAGLRGRLDRTMTIYHPRRDMLSGQTSRSRAYGYGCGMGRVLRKQAKLPLLAAFVLFDLLRMLASLARCRLRPALLCAAHGSGVFAGFVAPY
jgi:glycosyltransferase involved in cell wall biosynthesis